MQGRTGLTSCTALPAACTRRTLSTTGSLVSSRLGSAFSQRLRPRRTSETSRAGCAGRIRHLRKATAGGRHFGKLWSFPVGRTSTGISELYSSKLYSRRNCRSIDRRRCGYAPIAAPNAATSLIPSRSVSWKSSDSDNRPSIEFAQEEVNPGGLRRAVLGAVPAFNGGIVLADWTESAHEPTMSAKETFINLHPLGFSCHRDASTNGCTPTAHST